MRTLLSCPINHWFTHLEVRHDGFLTADCIGNAIELLQYMKTLHPTYQEYELRLFTFFLILFKLGAKIENVV